jgi:lipid-binding SYLF domain-containing protein
VIYAKQFTRNLLLMIFVAVSLVSFTSSFAEDKATLNVDAEAALKSLYANEPKAKAIGEKSAGILVFPNIVRAGFVVGGSGGDGVLYKHGKAVGYYNSGSLSVGLQAGIQSFGYAIFFTTDAAMKKFENASGWNVGTAPTLVVVDAGVAKNLDTTTLKSDNYAFVFDQKGLMAGLALKGQKITKIK